MARALSQSPWSARVGWRVRRPEARTRATCFLVPEEETLRSQRDMSYAEGELVSKWKKEVIARGNKKTYDIMNATIHKDSSRGFGVRNEEAGRIVRIAAG